MNLLAMIGACVIMFLVYKGTVSVLKSRRELIEKAKKGEKDER